MKIQQALREIIRTGEIIHGTKETMEQIEQGNAELVVIAENTPREIRKKIEEKTQEEKIPLKIYPGTSKELGETCRRPHLATTITVKDTGNVKKQQIQ